MAEVPSLKGSLLTELAEDLGKLIADGGISRSLAERRLTPRDRELLGAPIVISAWYDVRFYTRCAELLRDTVGAGRNQHLLERGFAKGRRLMEAGLYQQMEYVKRIGVQRASSPEGRCAAYGRDLRLMVSLSRSLLNFTRWTVSADPKHADRHLIIVDEAEAYPETLAWGTQGLIESMASIHGHEDLWRHRRTAPDRVEFYMTRSL